MTGTSAAARVAIVGTGAISQVVHLPILTRMRGVDVVGIYDTDRLKATTLAERFSVARVYGSLDEVWRDETTDAIVVCTPNHLHEEQVTAGLDAGKYVFCEKPLALTEEAAQRVLALSGAEDHLMVGMNQRFRPDAAALRSFVAAGDLGHIQYVSAGWLNRRTGRPGRSWRHRKEGAGGGVLMDLGIQMLDLGLWLLDYPDPVRISAHLHPGKGAEVEDSAALLLELEGHRQISLELTWRLIADRDRQHLHLVGSDGSASLTPFRIHKQTDDGIIDVSPQLTQGRENQFTASYRQELAHFIGGVRGEHAIEAPVEQATLLRIVEGAYRSARQGSEVVFGK